MTNQDRYQSELNAGRYIEAAKLALQFAGNCGSNSATWNWSRQAIAALTEGDLPDLAVRLRDALDNHTSWPDLDAAQSVLEPFTATTPSTPSTAWQPTSPLPWPDQVNEQLSRHSHGLEDLERRVAVLEAALTSTSRSDAL